MNRRRLEQFYFAGLAVVVLVSVFAFIWPNYRRASEVSVEIQSLESLGKLSSPLSHDSSSEVTSLLDMSRLNILSPAYHDLEAKYRMVNLFFDDR